MTHVSHVCNICQSVGISRAGHRLKRKSRVIVHTTVESYPSATSPYEQARLIQEGDPGRHLRISERERR